MRIAGYTLLFIGFGVFLFQLLGNARQQNVWREKLATAMEESRLPAEHPVAVLCFQLVKIRRPRVLEASALLMVTGGFILDLAKRRTQPEQRTPQPVGSGNGRPAGARP